MHIEGDSPKLFLYNLKVNNKTIIKKYSMNFKCFKCECFVLSHSENIKRLLVPSIALKSIRPSRSNLAN